MKLDIRDIVAAQGTSKFMVLTQNQVRAFSDIDQCEKYVATLGNQQFAVVQLLWTGGTFGPKEQGRARATHEAISVIRQSLGPGGPGAPGAAVDKGAVFLSVLRAMQRENSQLLTDMSRTLKK